MNLFDKDGNLLLEKLQDGSYRTTICEDTRYEYNVEGSIEDCMSAHDGKPTLKKQKGYMVNYMEAALFEEEEVELFIDEILFASSSDELQCVFDKVNDFMDDNEELFELRAENTELFNKNTELKNMVEVLCKQIEQQ